MTNSEKITHITNIAEFDQAVQNADKDFIFVDFWAEWCGPCRFSAPVVDKIADNLPQVQVLSVDVDRNQELSMRYHILSIPTFLLFKKGEPQVPAAVVSGFGGEPGMLNWLEQQGVDISALAKDTTQPAAA